MSRFTFILNPHAGKGSAGKMGEPLKKVLAEKGVSYELFITSRPGEAAELARKASGDVVVAIGGDGTVNEVANGASECGKTIGIIPAGSGNDFIKSIKQARSLSGAVASLLNGRTRKIDVGRITCSVFEGSGARPTVQTENRIFVNGVGVGFDAAVAVRMQQIRFLSGTAVYVLAVLQTLGKFKAPEFLIAIDSLKQTARNLLIAVGNGRCVGGGFYLTPDARIDDGKLDLCMIKDLSVPRILRLMPLVMIGKHKHVREVSFARAEREIQIESADPFCVHADGEIVGKDVNSVKIQLLPQHLSILEGYSR